MSKKPWFCISYKGNLELIQCVFPVFLQLGWNVVKAMLGSRSLGTKFQKQHSMLGISGIPSTSTKAATGQEEMKLQPRIQILTIPFLYVLTASLNKEQINTGLIRAVPRSVSFKSTA